MIQLLNKILNTNTEYKYWINHWIKHWIIYHDINKSIDIPASTSGVVNRESLNNDIFDGYQSISGHSPQARELTSNHVEKTIALSCSIANILYGVGY